MRLIDVDKLLETLQDLEPHCNNKQYENGMLKMLRYYMPQIINDEPTAYDIDKVVEELKKESFTTTDTLCGGIFKAIRLSSAIEIVKQGGVSDDVCVWRIVDIPNNLPIYNTSCGKIRLQYVTGVDIYCNGCGKKIKVVE